MVLKGLRSKWREAALCLFAMQVFGGWTGAQETKGLPQQVCAVLATGDASIAVSEVAPDTARIQAALDRCDPRQAVLLKGNGKKSVFLSAPLIIPRGVTLLLDKGTILYASRNPRDYDLSPGSCGGPQKEVPTCKPFLFSYQAPFSGVGGSGVIDGQGDKPLQGQHGKSWWSLEQEMSAAGKSISSPDLVSVYESQGFSLHGVTLRNAAGMPAAIFKTIGFRSSGLKIDAQQSPAASTGMLLSNAVDASIENAWIRSNGEALILKPSILGSTSKVLLRDIHIFGGKGILFGDDQYGDTRSIDLQDITFKDSQLGLRINFRGMERGKPQNIHLQNACMQNVALPFAVDGDSGIAVHAITFDHAVVNGKGALNQDGIMQDGSASCGPVPEFSAAPEAEALPVFPEPRQPGSRTRVRVTADGSGDFRTVQDAVDALPLTGGDIAVASGTYREVVTIRKPYVHLHGTEEDAAKTVLVFNHGPSDGGTFASATVFVEADDVTVDHLTIENDLGQKGQAVALAALGDRDIFRNLRILGAQDTLFASAKLCYGDYGPCVPARQYFADSYIAGAVDFIFGDSKAVFDRCELHGIANGNVMYTAQSKHYPQEESGYIISHSKLTADSHAGTIALGRAWRPYSTVVYLNTEMDAPIVPAGWVEWLRFGKSTLQTAFYAEYHSTGPGSDPKSREPHSHQLTEMEAKQWDPANFLAGRDGWNPLIQEEIQGKKR